MKFNKILLRILCFTLILAMSCGVAAKLHVDGAEYKVEFDANGGTGVASQYVAQRGFATAPADPTREGYTFVGWFFNENLWSFETAVKGNMVLVAHWEKLPAECPHVDKNDDGKCDKCAADFEDGNDLPAPTNYTIVYMDGATKLNLKPSSYNSTSTNLTLPTPAAKAHLEFVGWYFDADFTTLATEINVNANANLVLYAKYSPVTYKLNYQLDGGVNAESNVPTYNVYDLPFNLAAPTKDGYEFKGWYTDANCTVALNSITAENAGNLTVYAKWEKILVPFHVTYLDNNGNVIGSDIFYESAEDQALRVSYELDGYVFLNWFDPTTLETVTCIPAGTANDITVQANMEKVINYHTVTYFLNGVEYASVNFAEDTGVASLLSVSKLGYLFDGWYNETDDVVTSIPANTTEDVALYGTLTAIVYNVKFYDDNGNELFFELSSYIVSDTEIALPAVPDKMGATTLGWYTAEGEKMTAIPANFTGDIALYANYESHVYTITYYANGGINSEDNVDEYVYGDIPTLYAPLSRDGYVFCGWYTTAEFSGEVVESLEEYPNQSITLFAKWEKIVDTDGTMTPEVPF